MKKQIVLSLFEKKLKNIDINTTSFKGNSSKIRWTLESAQISSLKSLNTFHKAATAAFTSEELNH